MMGTDDLLRTATIPDCPANVFDTILHAGIADELGHPDLSAQFVLGDHPVTVLNKIRQQVEYQRAKPNILIRSVERMAFGIQDTVCKHVQHTAIPPARARITIIRAVYQ